jgi:spore coat polysaccharide biosynthesis protein SpsF (cytidylyltransferase family)
MAKAIFIQARMSSQRFPQKMLEHIVGHVPLVEYVYKRCLQADRADMVSVLTSEDISDDGLFDYCLANNIKVHRGSLNNVLDRYIKAGEHFEADTICRVCGDTPFVDVETINASFDILISKGLDYVAPDRNTCAAGFYSETVSFQVLKEVAALTKSPEDLEHVTKFILDNKHTFNIKLLNVGLNPEFLKNVRFTVDHPGDMDFCSKIAKKVSIDYLFTSQDVLDAVKRIKGI